MVGLVSAGGRVGSTAFMFSFYYFVVLVVFNIFVSFIIDGLTSIDLEGDDAVDEKVQKFKELIDAQPDDGFEVIVKPRGSQNATQQRATRCVPPLVHRGSDSQLLRCSALLQRGACGFSMPA